MDLAVAAMCLIISSNDHRDIKMFETTVPQRDDSAAVTWDGRSSDQWTKSMDDGKNSLGRNADQISQTRTERYRSQYSTSFRLIVQLHHTVPCIRYTQSSTFPTDTESVWWIAALPVLLRLYNHLCAVMSLSSEFDPNLQWTHVILITHTFTISNSMSWTFTHIQSIAYNWYSTAVFPDNLD